MSARYFYSVVFLFVFLEYLVKRHIIVLKNDSVSSLLFSVSSKIIFAAGALVNRYWLCEVGRFVFGWEVFPFFFFFLPIMHVDGQPQSAGLLTCSVTFAKLTRLSTLPSPPHPTCVLFVSLLVSVGGESLAVAQNTYAVNWFKGKELNLVFGLQLSMARLVRTS